MRKLINHLLLFLSGVSVSACDDKDTDTEISTQWEVVSNSDTDCIRVVNHTSDIFLPKIIYVNAIYKEGDVELRCENSIGFTLIGPNDEYKSVNGHFSVSKTDNRTLKIHFERCESGKPEYQEQLTVFNTDNQTTVNTFIYISRTFGELSPNL